MKTIFDYLVTLHQLVVETTPVVKQIKAKFDRVHTRVENARTFMSNSYKLEVGRCQIYPREQANSFIVNKTSEYLHCQLDKNNIYDIIPKHSQLTYSIADALLKDELEAGEDKYGRFLELTSSKYSSSKFRVEIDTGLIIVTYPSLEWLRYLTQSWCSFGFGVSSFSNLIQNSVSINGSSTLKLCGSIQSVEVNYSYNEPINLIFGINKQAINLNYAINNSPSELLYVPNKTSDYVSFTELLDYCLLVYLKDISKPYQLSIDSDGGWRTSLSQINYVNGFPYRTKRNTKYALSVIRAANYLVKCFGYLTVNSFDKNNSYRLYLTEVEVDYSKESKLELNKRLIKYNQKYGKIEELQEAIDLSYE